MSLLNLELGRGHNIHNSVQQTKMFCVLNGIYILLYAGDIKAHKLWYLPLYLQFREKTDTKR